MFAISNFDYNLWVFSIAIGLIAWFTWSVGKKAAGSGLGQGFAKGFFDGLRK